ncbi:hypothetical protein HK103_000631 [Boothiomyces macroporosus]|uniref:Amino acid transporter transmembrane domain-containing protein n=1 Tax=Boothiomyces macroporosus TaxID=261099 RepID=A0AAD5YA80_9FUNG|nr:hypothetical protein HK103_000631 [Boothiomyces macroporosus]
MSSTIEKLLKQKNIGFFAGVCFLFNAASGPAVPYTASNFQSPGWLITIISYGLFTILAGFCNLFLVESMQAIPGNKHFQGNVEFSTLVNFYFGRNSHLLAQMVLYAALQSNAVQCLVLCAQSVDQFILNLFGRTCGLSMGFEWVCVSSANYTLSPSPFGRVLMLFTLGLIVTLILCIPLAFVDLDSNVTVTIGAAVLTLLVLAQWMQASIVNGLDGSRMPIYTPIDISYGQTMGTIMMNLGCATVIPSWVNIKAMHVNTQSVMWLTLSITAVFYIVIGIFFALGFDINSSNNSLSSLLSTGTPVVLCNISVALYSLTMLLPSVPVNFIVSYKNLVQNGVCGRKVATFLAVILPCLIAIPLQTRDYLFLFLTWTSLIFVSSANFILPFFIYFKCVKFREEFNLLSLRQLKLLSIIHDNAPEMTKVIELKTVALLQAPVPPTIVLTPPMSSNPENNHEIEIIPEDIIAPEIQQLLGTHSRKLKRGSVSSQGDMPREGTADFPYLDEYAKVTLMRTNTDYPVLHPNTFVDPRADISQSIETIGAEIPVKRMRTFSTVEDYSKVTVREPRKSAEEYPKLKDVKYLDATQEWINTDWFQDDVPDPETRDEHPIEEDLDIPLEVVNVQTNELSVPSVKSMRRTSSASGGSKLSECSSSLPRDPRFKAPPFRAVPKWIPIPPKVIASTLLCTTIVVSVGNIIFQLVFL